MQLSELLYKAKKNDRQAQTMLYHQFKVNWFTICLRYCSNKADASDVLQNALIKIFQKMNQFDDQKGNFKSWSNKIVVNENLMFLRSNKNSFKNDEIIDDVFVDHEVNTIDDVLAEEEIVKLVQTLPNGYRMIFNLYAIEGFTHVEIADQLGISVGTSKSQLSKARKLLQKKLEVIL